MRYGLRVFGGAVPLQQSQAETPVSTGASVIVNGQAQFCLAGTLQIQSSIGRRSQASCTLRTTTATHFEENQRVQIFDKSGTLVFNGYLNPSKEQRPGFQKFLLHALTAKDGHWLADKRRVNKAYVNQTPGAIVYQIWYTILRNEGVTIGAIFDGPTPSQYLAPSEDLAPGNATAVVPSAVFSYAKVSEAYDALAKQASYAGIPYFWQIDEKLQLWFVPYTYNVRQGIVDGSKIDQVFNPVVVQRGNPTYFNTKYVTGATVQTSMQTETGKGDGSIAVWTMAYPLYSAPKITLNGVAKTVGVQGVDSGKDYYWSQGSPTISQDSGGTKLVSSDTLSVDYVGQYPTIFYAQDPAQVSYQAALDDSSGVVEDVENNDTITSFDSGISYISQMLARYAKQGVILQFSTLDPTFQQGQLITVNMPDHALSNAQMLIESVQADDQDGLNIWHRITAIIGPYDMNWVYFFSKLLKQPQKAENINVGVSQVVQTLQVFQSTIKVAAKLRIKTIGGLSPSNSLAPSSTLAPS